MRATIYGLGLFAALVAVSLLCDLVAGWLGVDSERVFAGVAAVVAFVVLYLPHLRRRTTESTPGSPAP